MATPINFTQQELRMLQSTFTDMYFNDTVRSIEGPLIHSILNKLDDISTLPLFTEQENRRIQVAFESYVELVKPYPYPYSPLTFSQDTRQLQVIQSILAKVEAAQ